MKLRYYQFDAQTAVQKNVERGILGNLVVIPVGGGKSVIIGHLALWALRNQPGKKALILAHRKELSTQNAQKIQTIDPSIKLGFEKSKDICPKEANIMMASIQTIGKEGIERVRRWADPKEIGVILVDEAHHIPGGKTYQILLEEIRRENPNVIVVGFTATPKRGDGEKIEDYISHVAYEIGMAELVEKKFLARIIGFKIRTETSMGDFVGEKRKDFDEKKLAKLVNNIKRNQLAVDIYKNKHQGQSALAFCVSKAHARAVATMFIESGVKAACITEDTPEKERENLLQAFKDGEIQVLTNAMVLTEGFDAPKIQVLFMLRPTKSPVLLEQMIGRGLRLIAYPNPRDPEGEWLIDWESKSNCHIYDFVDQKATQAGACNLATMLDLNPEFDMNGEDVFGLKARMDSHSEGDPLLAAALAQAHTPEEIEMLLQSHNLMAELQAIRYVPDQSAQWMEISPSESWIQLPYGETARVHVNSLGAYELDCPPINLEPRQKSREKYLEENPDRSLPEIPSSNTPDQKTLVLGEKGKVHLQAQSLEEALAEASELFFEALPCDKHLLKSNSTWKTRAKEEPATQAQKNKISSKRIEISEEDLQKLSKADASELILKSNLQSQMMAHQGRISFGQYQGAPLHLIHLYDPSYYKWMGLNTQTKLEAANLLKTAEEVPNENPIHWLANYRPRLYEKDFAGMEEFYEKEWAKDPEDVRKTIKFALDNDASPPWPMVLQRKEDRKKRGIPITRTPHA